jgi:hypothetical protein
MGQADGSKPPKKFLEERKQWPLARETEHGNGNASCGSDPARWNLWRNCRGRNGGREGAPRGALNRRSVMAGMELVLLHCELLSSRGWARAGEELFPWDR